MSRIYEWIRIPPEFTSTVSPNFEAGFPSVGLISPNLLVSRVARLLPQGGDGGEREIGRAAPWFHVRGTILAGR